MSLIRNIVSAHWPLLGKPLIILYQGLIVGDFEASGLVAGGEDPIDVIGRTINVSLERPSIVSPEQITFAV
jgi:hypothetical protein